MTAEPGSSGEWHLRIGRPQKLGSDLSTQWSFVAVRCDDEEVSYGRLDVDQVPRQRLVF